MMKGFQRLLQASLIAAAAATVNAASPGAARCASFAATLKLENTSITATTYLTANETFVIPDAHPTCAQNATTPVALCRLELLTKTTSTSQVVTELWLPDNFNKRVAATGNGGFNGCVDYDALNYIASMGFAVIGSDNGHTGQTGEPFLNHPEVINDFGYRAIHTEAVLMKQVARAYYGVAHKKAYWMGCSTGGRQGFKSIQDYPADFDGVLAGAPAVDFNRLLSWSGALLDVGLQDPAAALSPELLSAVQADAIARCDALDGVTNGIIDEPNNCDPTPSAKLLCAADATDTTTCLTPAQLRTLKVYFTALTMPDGTKFPRVDPGTPFAPLSFFIENWHRYVVYNSTAWDPATDWNTTDAFIRTDAINPGGIASWAPEKMHAFAARGGKVLTYHGTTDPLIPSGSSIKWYNAVQKSVGAGTMAQFYRFFRVPGMDHCYGGTGTGAFGQLYPTTLAPGAQTAANNVVQALVAWVESGRKPETLVAGNSETGVQRTLCAWPKKSVLKKGGDKSKAEGWKCV
ncbi:tannase and feruloyl esterase [Geopyxis carbonaria]|nr:tannase and feruloyl esterase [Geopyxis carbonaria]